MPPNRGSGGVFGFGGNLNGSSLLNSGDFKFGNSSVNGGKIDISNYGNQGGKTNVIIHFYKAGVFTS